MGEEINLLEYYYLLKKKWKFFAFFILIFNALVITGLFLWPQKYAVEAVLLPVSSEKPSQISSLTALGGLAGLMDQGSKNLNQLTTFLESRSLAQVILEKEGIKNRFIEVQKIKIGKEPPRLEDLATMISKKIIRVQTDARKGLVELEIITRDPLFSYDLMISYLVELKNFIQKNHVTSARRNREFVGAQLIEVQKELLEAGKNISNYYQEYKIPTSSSKINVQISLPLYGNITSDDQVFFDFSMDQRKELIDSLMKDKNSVKEKMGQVSVKDVPQQNYLEYLTIQKVLLTKLQTLLAEQYEMARLDEAKESLSFQVVDGPVLPKKPSSPKKKIIILASVVASVILGFFVIILGHYLRIAREDYFKNNRYIHEK